MIGIPKEEVFNIIVISMKYYKLLRLHSIE